MEFVKDTFRYLKKSFWLIALFCLAPAIILGIFSRPLASVTFVPIYSESEILSFSTIFWLFFKPLTVQTVFPLILIFISLLASGCVVFSFIERHFRVGRLTLKTSFAEVNGYFFPVLWLLLTLSAVLIIYSLLLTGLVTLQHFVISGTGRPNSASVIIALVLSLTLFALFAFFSTPVIFMLPLMEIYGYSFADSLHSAISYMGNAPFKTTFGLLFGFIVVGLGQFVLSFFTLHIAATIFISTSLFLFLIVYTDAYVMVTSFKVIGIQRKDIKRYY